MRILCIDDHRLFAESLKLLLQDDCVQTLNTPEMLTEVLAAFRPELVLLDIHFGKTDGQNGLDILKKLKQRYPSLKIVMLTGYDLPVYRQEARQSGAAGFISKCVAPERLKRLLDYIASGHTYYEGEDQYFEPLTQAEKTILKQVAQGEKRKAIAEKLAISERTVSNHLQHIFEKLGVNSAVEAVVQAMALGYL